MTKYTHAHKNIIMLSNSLEHLEKKTKRFSLPPPTRISIISRSSLLDFFSFFPSSSWNITRGQFAQFRIMWWIFHIAKFFFFFTKRGGRKGRDEYFSVGRRGATRSTTADDRAGSSVRVRAQQVTRQCESIEAKKSNAGVCRYTRWADYVERRTGEMEEAAT